MVLVFRRKYLCILVIYFFALIEAVFSFLIGLKFAWLYALVILVCELEIDLHTLLAF